MLLFPFLFWVLLGVISIIRGLFIIGVILLLFGFYMLIASYISFIFVHTIILIFIFLDIQELVRVLLAFHPEVEIILIRTLVVSSKIKVALLFMRESKTSRPHFAWFVMNLSGVQKVGLILRRVNFLIWGLIILALFNRKIVLVLLLERAFPCYFMHLLF